MSRWVITCIATSLVLSSTTSLWSWGQPRAEQGSSEKSSPEMPSTLSSFPLNDQQQWYMKESYLLWHPQEDDVDWADRIGQEVESGFEFSLRMKKPDLDWYSGVRLGVGRYLSNHDHWDVSLTATYFYANSVDHSTPKIADNQSLQPTWSPLLFSTGFNKGEETWRLNFFTFDFGLGRNTTLSSKITAHPFVDLRTALIYENDATRYSFTNTSGFNKIRFKGFNDYWGVGPRIGSDFTYYLMKCWTLIGSLSGSVLLGGSKVQQNVRIFQRTNSDSKQYFRASHHEFAVRGNLEGSIGMGWEKWMSRNRVRIAPSIVFEAAQWYDMNQWIALKAPTGVSLSGPSYFETDRHHGDLTLWGFNFNLQVDF